MNGQEADSSVVWDGEELNSKGQYALAASRHTRRKNWISRASKQGAQRVNEHQTSQGKRYYDEGDREEESIGKKKHIRIERTKKGIRKRKAVGCFAHLGTDQRQGPTMSYPIGTPLGAPPAGFRNLDSFGHPSASERFAVPPRFSRAFLAELFHHHHSETEGAVKPASWPIQPVRSWTKCCYFYTPVLE